MESPFNRPKAANLIGDVITQHFERMMKEPFLAGFSLEMQIYTKLLEAGYLTEEAKESDDK